MREPACYSLVRTLSKTERRLFSRYLRKEPRKGTNNYAKWFQALCKMEVWDFQQYEKLVGGDLARHTGANLSKLRSQLLQFLRHLEEERSLEAQLDARLQEVRILFRKGLYKDGSRHLQRAKAQAKKGGKSVSLLRIGKLEREILFRKRQRGLQTELENQQAEIKAVLADLNDEMELQDLFLRVHALAKQDFALSEASSKELFKTLQASPLLQEPDRFAHPESILHQFEIRGQLALMEGDFDAAMTAYRHSLEILRSRPESQQEYFAISLALHTNYLNACMLSNRYDLFRETALAMRDLPVPHPDDRLRLQENMLHLELYFYMNSGNFSKALRLAPDIEAFLDQFQKRLSGSKFYSFCYNLSVLYFVQERFSDANRWLRTLVNAPRSEYRKDITGFTAVLQMAIQLELGHGDLLADLLRSFRRSPGRKEAYAAAVADYIEQVVRKGELVGDSEAAEQLQDTLEVILKKGGRRMPPGLVESYCWIRGRIKGIPIREVYLEGISNRRT